MKILLINSWYYPNMRGGAEQSTKALAEQLYKNGHDVAVLSADGLTANVTTEMISRIVVYRCKTYLTNDYNTFVKKIIRKRNDIKYTKVIKDLKYVINMFHPEVIHTNSLSGFSFYIWKYFYIRKIPIIHTLRDYSLFSPKGLYERRGDVSIFYWLFLKWYYKANMHYAKYISYITAPSDFTLSTICALGFFEGIPGQIVPNAIEYNMEDTKEYIKERCSRKSSHKYIMFAGRLLKFKGINLLLEAFEMLDNENYRLVICGEGECEQSVLNKIEHDPRIIYKGQLSKERLEENYKKADIVVFPSLWDEPFGRIIIEANKFGVPVITTNRGGIPEIINTLGGGIILSEETAEVLATTIDKMLNSDISLYCLNILKNLHYYSIRYQADEFEKIYNRLAGENK